MQALILRVGDDLYAVDAARIAELVPAVPVRPVPGVRPAVRGVIAWRGRVVPVLDLARHFGRGDCPVVLGRRIAVVDFGDGVRSAMAPGRPVLGLLVEEASRVVRLDADATAEPTEPLPAHLAGLGRIVATAAGLVQWVRPEDLVPEDVLASVLEAASAPAEPG